MNKMFSFLAGGLCGSLLGATLALLLTPASGDDLRASAQARWEEAMAAAQQAREETQQQLTAQFEQMKQG
jgi:gas vesicle protein